MEFQKCFTCLITSPSPHQKNFFLECWVEVVLTLNFCLIRNVTLIDHLFIKYFNDIALCIYSVECFKIYNLFLGAAVENKSCFVWRIFINPFSLWWCFSAFIKLYSVHLVIVQMHFKIVCIGVELKTAQILQN